MPTRAERTAGWIDHLARDVRYACRALTRHRGLAAAAVATLALGIGANTAIFSVVHAVLIRPLPYAQPDRIYSAEIVIPARRAQFRSLPVSVQVFLEWRRTAPAAIESFATLRPWECNLIGDGEPERAGGARVSANFFSFLGVPIAQGRGFSSDEEQPGRERVVVISDALWRRRYGADPAVIGRRIAINGESHLVVGIAPPSLLMPTGTLLHELLPFAPRIDVWKPIAPTPNEMRNESWDHGVLVRLRPDATPEQGRDQLGAILNAYLHAQVPELEAEALVDLVPMREIYAGAIRLRLLLLLGASALVLLAACTNLANLWLARITSRAGELATRIALGAGRARILGQTLAETTVVALLGGAVGALLAIVGARALATYGPDAVHLLAGTTVNVAALVFALVVSVATGLVCGVVPAVHAWRQDAARELQQHGRAVASARARQLLIGVETALGAALLASSGLLLHSFVNVMRADRGYQIERVLAVDLSLFGPRYGGGRGVVFYRELAERVQSLPGVVSAGAISDLPAVAVASGASRTILFESDIHAQQVMLSRPVATIRSVTTGYFAASGTALRAGRVFRDDEPQLAAVISEGLGRRLWPQDSAASLLGRRIHQGDGRLITIVGVVEDVRPGAVDRDPAPVVYRPHPQWASGPMTLVVRTAQEPGTLASAVRAEIRKMDPELPIAAVRTLRDIVSDAVAPRRFQMVLTSLFAVVALLLTAIGLYGVVSYAVAARTREIGIRVALGAGRHDVMRWVFANGMQPVLVGLVVGLAGAIAIAGMLQALLFGITPTDPLSLSVVAAVLLLTSCLACYLPARRAAGLDPTTALRHD